MEESLFSNTWYRVADLKPRLRSHAEVHRHTYRGQDWYVLQDHATGRFHRFSPEAYLIIGLMDGERRVDEIWDVACERLGDDMPTQDEVIGLIGQLYAADVMQSDVMPDIADLHQRHVKEQRNRLLSYVRSPMSVRFPLLDPERFLVRTQAVAQVLFGWPGVLVWFCTVVPALFLGVIHWQDLTAGVTDQVFSLGNLLLIGLIYPFVKACHELGHAYAVKRWEGEVHEMGIMLLVFMPIPYVDASASSAFRARRRRMLVSAAGILVELFLAALAMFVWVSAEPGAVRAMAFNVMLIGGVSTLLFNGNPLLRYDGYYILADYLEIPNLSNRGSRYLSYLFQRYALKISDAQSPATSPGEAVWLGCYAVAASIYRLFIMVAIALIAAGKFFVLGVVVAGWAIVGFLAPPLIKAGRFLFQNPNVRSKRARTLAICGSALGLVALLVGVIPLPLFTMAEGVVWAPEKSRVRVGADGFIQAVTAAPGQVVRQGDLLIRCENADLTARVKVLEAQLKELQMRHRSTLMTDRTEAKILEDEMARVDAELKRSRDRQSELLIRSQTDGVFLLPQPEDLPGRFVRRGAELGYVMDFSRTTVRVVVPQSEAGLVRSDTRAVEARLAEQVQHVISARVVRETPAASTHLPSLALSLEGGGEIVLDPQQREAPQAFERLFQFEAVLSGAEVNRVGERVYVRFEHTPEPVIFRWYRYARRLFLRRFEL